MDWLKSLAKGIVSLFQRRLVERELDEELQGYLEASVAHKQSNGMTAEQARRAAMVEFGSGNSVKHQIWASRWESAMEGILKDIRLSTRSLLKSPGFTATALLSLALGIGGNTAIFTLINQVLLRNLPVRDPQQLVTFGKSEYGGVAGGIDLGGFGGYFPWDFTRQMEANPGPFQGIAAYGSFSNQVSIRTHDDGAASSQSSPALLAPANLVSGNYFSVLGAQPLLGRTIVPSDDATPGSGAVVVLSYHFWQQSLSSNPHVVGKTISINGTPFEVVGVMPQAFHGIKQDLEPTELWTPISMQTVVLQQPTMLTPHSGLYFLHLFARLTEGAAAHKAEFAQSQNWLNQQIRDGMREREGTNIPVDRQIEISRIEVPLVRAAHGVSLVRSQYGESLQILMIVVALVLLIACANLANFLLSRATTRRHEILTRLALGSNRMRIVRQGLVETFLLSFVGGFMGLGIAFAATRALIAFVSRGNAYVDLSPTPNSGVLLFTLGVSLLTGILFGLAPSIHAARIGSHGTLSAGARTAASAGGKMARFWPKALVTLQVMLSLVLLVVAGLFLRTLRNLQDQDYGFERSHLLLADVGEHLAGYAPHQVAALHQTLLDRLSAIPGVRSAALSATPPISFGSWTSNISLAGYTPAPKENMVSILNRVSGQYFETAGISIVAGRAITPADTTNSLKVAVVSQTLARKYFPKGDAIGKQLTIGIDSVKGPWQIVGIARDTKPGDPRITDPVRMTYIPLSQIETYLPAAVASVSGKAGQPTPREENEDCYAHTILIRTTSDPEKTIADLRAAVAQVDPNLPLLQVTTIRDQVSNLISHDELISTLTSLFSLLALLLAAIGLYGVMSYNVARRTNEIGIRIALGAQSANVLRMIMRESLVLLAIGTVLGLPLAVLATRIIKEQLFAVGSIDPVSFAVALLVVSLMTMAAGWLPARRAAGVDPVTALRFE
ncbi:ABC transporter permease [Telmatobacter sp. DSM 110680]|uniref:ABC transporter permease n=1 Tax=Telmatobacter sp. DSM 110680 TaxID=3036704 RepID=A0AAU7DEY8_9BACT